MKKIALIFAHPDDESFATGGTVAKYVAAGWQVDLLCATRGEGGSSGMIDKKGDALGVLRAEELRKAANVLGITSVTILDYKDGSLSKKNPGELEDIVYKFLEEHIPDVIITFEPSGISNHPDHTKICLSATVAYQNYAEWLHRSYELSQLYVKHDELWFKRFEALRTKAMEPKLYYVCVPSSIVSYAQKSKSIPIESFGKKWKGVPDKKITTAIDVGQYSKVKEEALRMHETQIVDVDRFVSMEGNPLFDKEFFILRMHGTEEIFMGKHDVVADGL